MQPAIAEFCWLCRLNYIHKQDGNIISGGLLQLRVFFNKLLLFFSIKFMWPPCGFLIAEAVPVQPLIHTRNTVAHVVPFFYVSHCAGFGNQSVIGQILFQLCILLRWKVLLWTTIFRCQFTVAKIINNVAKNCCFMNELRLGNNSRRPSLSRQKQTTYSVAAPAVTAFTI